MHAPISVANVREGRDDRPIVEDCCDSIWFIRVNFLRQCTEERKRQSAEESADESQQSIAEEENKSKEVTSEAEVKAATDAPAGVSTSDLEMAKSRSRHYRSKEKSESLLSF